MLRVWVYFLINVLDKRWSNSKSGEYEISRVNAIVVRFKYFCWI